MPEEDREGNEEAGRHEEGTGMVAEGRDGRRRDKCRGPGFRSLFCDKEGGLEEWCELRVCAECKADLEAFVANEQWRERCALCTQPVAGRDQFKCLGCPKVVCAGCNIVGGLKEPLWEDCPWCRRNETRVYWEKLGAERRAAQGLYAYRVGEGSEEHFVAGSMQGAWKQVCDRAGVTVSLACVSRVLGVRIMSDHTRGRAGMAMTRSLPLTSAPLATRAGSVHLGETREASAVGGGEIASGQVETIQGAYGEEEEFEELMRAMGEKEKRRGESDWEGPGPSKKGRSGETTSGGGSTRMGTGNQENLYLNPGDGSRLDCGLGVSSQIMEARRVLGVSEFGCLTPTVRNVLAQLVPRKQRSYHEPILYPPRKVWDDIDMGRVKEYLEEMTRVWKERGGGKKAEEYQELRNKFEFWGMLKREKAFLFTRLVGVVDLKSEPPDGREMASVAVFSDHEMLLLAETRGKMVWDRADTTRGFDNKLHTGAAGVTPGVGRGTPARQGARSGSMGPMVGPRPRGFQGVCFTCGVKGHPQAECPRGQQGGMPGGGRGGAGMGSVWVPGISQEQGPGANPPVALGSPHPTVMAGASPSFFVSHTATTPPLPPFGGEQGQGGAGRGGRPWRPQVGGFRGGGRGGGPSPIG